ncbi:hypothetical protein [Spirosoma sp. 48-14]|uniref:hypothetical protein n=1 Tax=Spirosoma sp. 48-14 TaxID=1895854 RepID=UPI00095A6988|nr:hypothetical protein [Spirosoma sp. 48-14]OJW76286.1 MAG: hypothetical protein BGO59_22470 [Spirosoma sp. 48-14]
MSTPQKYVGRGTYASGSPFRGHQYRTQVYLLVLSIAKISGEAESEVWKRIYNQVHAYYGIYLPGLPKNRRESLLRVAERHDVLDKVYLVAQAERAHYYKTDQGEID